MNIDSIRCAPLGCFAQTGCLVEGPLAAPVQDRSPRTWDGLLSVPVRLEDGNRPAVLTHFLSLSEDDRRMRLMQVMPDHAIEAYMARMDFSELVRFGVFDAQQVPFSAEPSSSSRTLIWERG